jgi:integrase/recombinase XerD
MALKKRVRIIKKIRQGPGRWTFISMRRIGDRYVWDKRPGYFFIEWREGKKRFRELAGQTPSEASEAQRRKANELLGEMVSGGRHIPSPEHGSATPISDAIALFLEHIRVHSPDKPETVRRYKKVMEHVERHLRKCMFVEAITRSHIDDFKTKRSGEASQQHDRIITPRTINFEVSVLRTFFYFLINERGLHIENPCARYKQLKDTRAKANRRPPRYTQEEIDRMFEKCRAADKAIFATLLLTGLRKQELYFLSWPDVDLKQGTLKVTAKPQDGFSPKDYEERVIPIPPDLLAILKGQPRTSTWVFPNSNGNRLNHLLRKLKSIADKAEVQDATLHKFRHTYATRLLERGCDIVTVQKLMGHSDLETTRQYLDPDEGLKRKAVNRLSLLPKIKSKQSVH